MTDQRLPFAEIEVPCSTCGRMVLQPKRRAGRHARFCSPTCKAVALREQNGRARAKYRAKLKAGGGQKSEKVVERVPAPPSSAGFFPVEPNFGRGQGRRDGSENPEKVGSQYAYRAERTNLVPNIFQEHKDAES